MLKSQDVTDDVVRSGAGCVYDLLGFAHPFLVVPHNGMKFTTLDVDYDTYVNNCAVMKGGSWWFNTCGLFMPTSTLPPSWYCPTTNSWYAMTNIQMMVKLQ